MNQYDPWTDAVVGLYNDYDAGVIEGWPNDYSAGVCRAVRYLRTEVNRTVNELQEAAYGGR